MSELKDIKRFVDYAFWGIKTTESHDGLSIFIEFPKKILKERVQSQVTT